MNQFTINEWRPINSGKLWGSVTITTPSQMTIHNCLVFRHGSDQWVNPPSKPRIKDDKVFRTRDGKITYDPVISFESRERQQAFSDQVLAALNQHLVEARQ